MALSVLSKQVFLQGGISKCCSQLKGDIVEALQCVKCSSCNDLLFLEASPSSLAEVEPDKFGIEVKARQAATDEEGWDGLFLEEEDDDLDSNDDMDNF
jgi:hypothetical protein